MEINNESLGQAAEKVICDMCGLDSGDLASRSVPELEEIVKPIVEGALKKLPRIIKHVGLERGERGGQSKSSIDFVCENKKTVSVKTNKTSCKVCPSECGQPGQETFDHYFGHLYDGNINYDKFKAVCLNEPHQMMPIYLEHLFDCDYFVWIYTGRSVGYKIIKKENIPNFKWGKNRFSFSKQLDTWNESCTIYYDGKSLGEYQAHNHRNCYKFRFNLKNLCDVLNV